MENETKQSGRRDKVNSLVRFLEWDGKTKSYWGGWKYNIYKITLLFGFIPIWIRVRSHNGVM